VLHDTLTELVTVSVLLPDAWTVPAPIVSTSNARKIWI
jgi:hypothetical protein